MGGDAIFPPLDMALIGNISFTFQAIQKPFAHPVNLCCGVFCEFLRDFWVYLGRESFSRRIGKIKRKKKYGGSSELLKLKFVDNN